MALRTAFEYYLVKKQVQKVPMPSNFDLQAKLLGTLANEKRLQILTIIADKEMIVGQLALEVGLSQSALSQHLSKLRADELVTARRDQQNVYYTTTNPAVKKILDTLAEIYRDS